MERAARRASCSCSSSSAPGLLFVVALIASSLIRAAVLSTFDRARRQRLHGREDMAKPESSPHDLD